MDNIQILIIDLGSQYTLVISRTLRELGVRSAILAPDQVMAWLAKNKPKGIIVSGSGGSVFYEDAICPPWQILKIGLPVLGICYGMQWMALKMGGQIVIEPERKEYGATTITLDTKDALFSGLPEESIVWASHGDSVSYVPYDVKIIAHSEKKRIAGFHYNDKPLWGVQFHPEVQQTEQGRGILSNFIFGICDCEKDWHGYWDVENTIRDKIPMDAYKQKALLAFSGGVDSSTLAFLIARWWEGLLGVCINTGALRKNEITEIKQNAKDAHLPLKIINASRIFQQALSGQTDAERKRKIFKKIYQGILEQEAKESGARFLVQGTLATDLIESGATGEAFLIKSHHNVGLGGRLECLHPLAGLFKYEVRDLAKEIGLPDTITSRHPFPGPGLFLRVIGAPITFQRLAIVRWVDDVVTQILKKQDLYQQISQLVVALDCSKTVGVKGDSRVYGYSAIARAVLTSDFMTAMGFQLPPYTRKEIISRVTKHPKIVRVFFDETDKPPATIEFE